MNNKIAHQALKARSHLIEALKGLDEIIRLANEAGRDDVRQAAQSAKEPIRQAAENFNEEVQDAGGDPNRIDPIVIDQADKAAAKATEELKRLYAELKDQVDRHEERLDKVEQLVKPDPSNPWVRKQDLDSFKDGLTDHATTLYGKDGNSGLVNSVATINQRINELKSNKGNKSSFAFNARLGGIIGTATLVIAFLLLWLLFAATFSTALLWASTLALVFAVLGGFATAPSNKKNK